MGMMTTLPLQSSSSPPRLRLRPQKRKATKMVIFHTITTTVIGLVAVIALISSSSSSSIIIGGASNNYFVDGFFVDVHTSRTPRIKHFFNKSRKPTCSSWLTRVGSSPTAVEADNENNADSNRDSNDINADQQQPKCPFSTVIPRYQIELSSSPLKRQRQRSRRDKKNGSKFINGNIISNTISDMIEVPSKFFKTVTKAAQQQKLQKLPLRPGEALRIREDVDSDNGIGSMAYLWQATAELIETDTSNDNSQESSSSIVLALPGCSVDLVVNFVEIIEWMSSNNNDDDNDNNLLSFIDDDEIHAELLQGNGNEGSDPSSSSTIPVIRIRLTRTLSSSSSSSSSKSRQASGGNLDADIINERTRHWVRRLLVDEKICPFTRSDRMSGQGLGDLGVPVGSIAYHTSNAQHPIRLFADTWTAIHQMIEAGPEGKTGVSSILLAAPFYDDDFDTWAGPIFAVLEASVVAADAEKDIGVVCFHPRYATPDGSTFPGFGHMHSVPRLAKWWEEYSNNNKNKNKVGQSSSNDTEGEDLMRILDNDEVAAGGAWQRRTPHATINVLRAEQLAIAESRRESEILYPRNIERLIVDIGSDQLASDLEKERQMGTN